MRNLFTKQYFQFASRFIIIFLLFALHEYSGLIPRESLNKVIAIVGKNTITQMDFERASEKYKILYKKAKSPYKGSYKTQVMDFLIARQIIDLTADEETIIVNEKRVDAEVDRIMENMGFQDRAQFEKSLSDKIGIPFDMWLEELPYQIKKGQLLQVRVPHRTPSEAEIQKWYTQNKNRVGFEFKYREIVLKPKDTSFAEEEKISTEISQIEKEIRRDSSAFSLIASGPRNQSPHRGGFVDWTSIAEIYNKSKLTANFLMSIPEKGVSGVFRDEKNRYCIIKLEGRRPTPLDSIRRFVQEVIQREKMEESFDDWILERRKEIPITVYDSEYLKENKLEAPDESFNIDKVLEK
jgi:putative peptidyl-prolyl cis-trans isomerase